MARGIPTARGLRSWAWWATCAAQGLETEPIAQMFESLTQNPSRLGTLLVRTSIDDPLKMVGSVQAAVSRVRALSSVRLVRSWRLAFRQDAQRTAHGRAAGLAQGPDPRVFAAHVVTGTDALRDASVQPLRSLVFAPGHRAA